MRRASKFAVSVEMLDITVSVLNALRNDMSHLDGVFIRSAVSTQMKQRMRLNATNSDALVQVHVNFVNSSQVSLTSICS